MDDRRFDALTLTFAQSTSRRTALKGLLGGLIGGIAVTSRLDQAGAQGPCEESGDCPSDLCSVYDCIGNQCVLLTGCGAGELCCDISLTCIVPGQCCEDFECDSFECKVCSRLTNACVSACEAGEKCCVGSCIANTACCEAVDCGPPPPDSCSDYNCIGGECVLETSCFEGTYCCEGGCISNLSCCTDEDCTAGTCGVCFDGVCEYSECCTNVPCPTLCHLCSSSGCIDTCEDDEKCCGDACIPKDACCSESDCGPCQVCSDGVCEYPVSIPNGVCCGTPGNYYCAACCTSEDCGDEVCTDGHCCPPGDKYCPEGDYCYTEFLGGCCYDTECGSGAYCVDGLCRPCRDDSHCPDCWICNDINNCEKLVCELGETCCGNHECVPEDECCKIPGETCGLITVTAADGSPQLDCCDGLVCCENWNSQYPVCAECCNDWDCPKDASCNEGWCEWPDLCKDDKECPKGTCCCKDGSCSGKCCDKPHPPKPPKPTPPTPAPDPAPTPAPVTTLPATGSGDTATSSGLLGAVAVGAAALLAAKKLRETPESATEE